MERKKYKILDEVLPWKGKKYHVIQALIDIPEYGVKAGDKGGCIESERNLSQAGSCWIAHYGFATGKSRVYENAFVDFYCEVKDEARVHGHAQIKSMSTIREHAEICGQVKVATAIIGGFVKIYEYATIPLADTNWEYQAIGGHAKIHGHATVSSFAEIDGEADISGHAIVHTRAVITDRAIVCDNAVVRSEAQIRDDAYVGGEADIHERAMVYNHARVTGKVDVGHDAKVFGAAEISGDTRIIKNISISGSAVVTQGIVAKDFSGAGSPPAYWIASWTTQLYQVYNTGGYCSSCLKKVEAENNYLPRYCPQCGLTMNGVVSTL